MLDAKRKKFPYGSDWVTSRIGSAEDVAHAVWLFDLNYKRIKGEPVEKLMLEINNYKEVVKCLKSMSLT